MKLFIKNVAKMLFKYLLDNARKYELIVAIENAYREQASRDLILETRIIQVKKGKMKYNCLIIESELGKRRISLERFPDGQRTFKQEAA